MPKRKSPPLRASERREIERGLDAGMSLRAIAGSIGRQPSTVSREVAANRVAASPAGAPACPRLARAPHVCNGCPDLRRGGCARAKAVYRAGDAGRQSDRRRSESRAGIDMGGEEAEAALAYVGDCLARGMSPYEISATMPEGIRVSPGTVYGWVERGYVGCNLMLQRKVRFRPRKRRAAQAAPRRPESRSHAAFLALPEAERAAAWELDTVLGLSGDRQRVLTLYDRATRFQAALLLPSGRAGDVLSALGALRGACPRAFDEVLGSGPALTDNGAEFSDRDGLGALLGERPGGPVRLFCCDPMASGQKGGCEKNHTELRRVLAKGRFSFDLLVPGDLALAASHVSSAPRRSLGGACPLDAFLAAHGAAGAELLGALGVSKPAVLLLRPELLNAGRRARGEGEIPM